MTHRHRVAGWETQWVPPPSDVVTLFVESARTVARAVADPSVAEAWDRPSVLEDQLVSGLAGHLARGAVWVVADYLDGGQPSGPVDFQSAADYFTTLMRTVNPDAHRAIRDRGAAVAAAGHDALVRRLDERVGTIESILRSMDSGDRLAVAGGKVMRLADYLVTRIVEQVVHLDDLARSTDHEPWPVPIEAQDLVIEVGTEIARLRSGRTAVLRALYRRGFAEAALPVL